MFFHRLIRSSSLRRTLRWLWRQAQIFAVAAALAAAASWLRAAPQETTAVWQLAGPAAVDSAKYGLLAGRVSALALDPSDAGGNRLYVGATGGGVWFSQNAASGGVTFTLLTGGWPSLSIGALSVQPGGTGVVLAGTGDANNAPDSYYGAGILRSADGGATWTLITMTADHGMQLVNEAFAGFAWSTANPQLAVAAAAESYEGSLVGASVSGTGYRGLYYSADGGASWNLATILDGGSEVQGPDAITLFPLGSSVTAVVWNPVRGLFVAAVRRHGFYQSSDGATWTRIATQPGGGALAAANCPYSSALSGCPLFRGALAVNAENGDTFAWSVDSDGADLGLWRDSCNLSNGKCASDLAFNQQVSASALETGSGAIADGVYNLTLAALPTGTGAAADTILFAGTHDLWKCSLNQGCVWRNLTNFSGCAGAQAAGYQHAIAWNAANADEIFFGNDGGLWRTLDQAAVSGDACSADDASHFQNLNGSLGLLAEVRSLAVDPAQPYTVLAGLGVNGAAGVKASAAETGNWPQVFRGAAGPVAIDSTGAWYVNGGAGVAIYRCQPGASGCAPEDFGSAPVVSEADVGYDGLAMDEPAAFLIDPLDPTQMLAATCRLWRGPADGRAWTAENSGAIGGILDPGAASGSCSGAGMIHALAALKTADGGETIYVGLRGAGAGGGTIPGRVYRATLDSAGVLQTGWTDLTLNPIADDADTRVNPGRLEISSIAIDSHDAAGLAVYVTVAALSSIHSYFNTIYGSTDGGANWTVLTSNLPWVPANAAAVDPLDASTVYVATDLGVYSTRDVASCGDSHSSCWTAYGSGLPLSPVTALAAALASAASALLTAGTYGRGVWRIPLWTAGETAATASLSPSALDFPAQALGTGSSARQLTLTNTGGVALAPSAITLTGDFTETDNCLNQTIAVGAFCTINVIFQPTALGAASGALTVAAPALATSARATLTGVGAMAAGMEFSSSSLDFGTVSAGLVSGAQTLMLTNTGADSITGLTIAVGAGFQLASNGCAATLAAQQNCTVAVQFAPTAAGAQSVWLTASGHDGSAMATLTGAGFDFDVAASGAASKAVLVGGATSYGVTLTPQGGVGATFSLQCATSSSLVTCAITPASVTVAAGGQGAATVSVANVLASARNELPGPLFWLCGLLALPLARRGSRRLLMWAALAGMTALTSCGIGGGVSGGPDGSGAASAGTYAIVVTATANNLSHTLPLTLTVE